MLVALTAAAVARHTTETEQARLPKSAENADVHTLIKAPENRKDTLSTYKIPEVVVNVSPKQDASGCHQVFEALAEQLTNGGYGVQKLSCQQVTYSQSLDCLCCTATAELTGIFSADETGTSEGWQEIVIKTKGA